MSHNSQAKQLKCTQTEACVCQIASLSENRSSNLYSDIYATDGLVIFLRSCAVRIGPTEFLLIGGNKEGMEVEVEGKKILKFDTKTNKWTKMPGQLSQQRLGHACALYDDPEQPYVIIAGKVFG